MCRGENARGDARQRKHSTHGERGNARSAVSAGIACLVHFETLVCIWTGVSSRSEWPMSLRSQHLGVRAGRASKARVRAAGPFEDAARVPPLREARRFKAVAMAGTRMLPLAMQPFRSRRPRRGPSARGLRAMTYQKSGSGRVRSRHPGTSHRGVKAPWAELRGRKRKRKLRGGVNGPGGVPLLRACRDGTGPLAPQRQAWKPRGCITRDLETGTAV